MDQLAHMGTYTDTILLENKERLDDIEIILYSDTSGSTFVELLKHKLKLCSKYFFYNGQKGLIFTN